jgi:hypothetical protein
LSGEIVLADGEIALSGSCGREDSRFVKQICSPIVAANRVRQSYNMFLLVLVLQPKQMAITDRRYIELCKQLQCYARV